MAWLQVSELESQLSGVKSVLATSQIAARQATDKVCFERFTTRDTFCQCVQ